MKFFTHDNSHTHEFAGTCRCGWELIEPWPTPIEVDLSTVLPIQGTCPECGERVTLQIRKRPTP